MADPRDVFRSTTRGGKRFVVAVVGFTVIAIGIVLLPLPGPGWAIIFGGLAILATEFIWARRLRDKVRGYFRQAAANVRARRVNARGDVSGPTPGAGDGDRAA
jgi:uncharacterized protein (TIGR02611 family)